MTCLETGCDKSDLYARGLCASHYQAHRAAGTLPAYPPRACDVCGVSFIPSSSRSRYCQRQCKERAVAVRHAAEVKETLAGRLCVECGEPLTNRLTTKAITCSRECAVTYRNRLRAEARRQHQGPCLQCGEPIPPTRRSSAKFCTKNCSRLWRAQSEHARRVARSGNLKHHYGITVEDFEEMLAAQGGVCAVCKTDEWGGKHNVGHLDHDHATGLVRGILCDHCNNGLGRFKDDPVLLRAAAAYLERATVPA